MNNFIKLIILFVLFANRGFAQFGREDYAIDGLNKREILEIQGSTNLKSSVFSYAYLFPLTTLFTDALNLDFSFGCKLGGWIDKKDNPGGRDSAGIFMIPVGIGFTFRQWNPVNISVMAGFMGGFLADYLFTPAPPYNNPSDIFNGGMYLSGSVFIPLRNKLGIEVGYNRLFLPPLNNLSYISFGFLFGKYE